MLFKLQNVSFNFRNFALKNISFELQKGEILGIIGESGSGKTLLSLRILGLLDGICESKGEIIFNGAKVESMREFLGKEITYIPQEPLVALNPLHRIKKQVCEILELHNPKMPKNALDLRFAELMKMVDLDLKFGEVYPYELSGGQRQRVLMAIALANNPKIIIADEPTTALDSVLQKQILDLLRDLNQKLEIAVILITHNIAVVGHYADKILLLKNGEMVGNLSLSENNLPLPCGGDFSQSLPLPCGGGLRGWVDSANRAKIAESTPNCHIDPEPSEGEISQNNRDSSLVSLAQNDKKVAESNTKNTHPLAPSAREGESVVSPRAREWESVVSPRAREGEQKADSANQIKNAESTTISQNLIAESHTAHNLQSNNRSNGGVALRCFDAERAKIGHKSPLSEVSYQNNANEYPRTNCVQNPYLRDLLNATHFSYKNPNLTDEILLSVRNLSVFHTAKKHLFGKNTTKKTLHNINFELKKGEILGIIGESGSGKSTLALALLNLIKYDGDIIFGTQNYKAIRNFRAFRKHIQIVFQDPNSSLNARFRVREIIKEGLDIHYKNDSTKDKKVAEMLRFVGLDSSNLMRFPSELSGGQRQRIAIARALILNPQILILDEPTSALDKITQKQVLELLLRLKDEFGLSYILITHDLGIIRALCDSVIVLKNGEIAESGDKFMLESPKNPYTKSLVESIL